MLYRSLYENRPPVTKDRAAKNGPDFFHMLWAPKGSITGLSSHSELTAEGFSHGRRDQLGYITT